MDRDEALKLLEGGKEGVEEWNRRKAEGQEIPSISCVGMGVSLSNCNLA